MKMKFYHILTTTCIAFIAMASSYAQESTIVEPEFTENSPEKFESVVSERERTERERILNSPGEGDTRYIPRSNTSTFSNSSSSTSAARESSSKEAILKESDLKSGIPMQSKVKQTDNARSKSPEKQQPPQAKPNTDDSILSFNFLYYVIQKYKLQDIVD